MSEFRVYMHIHCQNWFQCVKLFLTPESMKLACILRNNSVALSHQTFFCSSKKRKLLQLFRKITSVYLESHMERANILRKQISEFLNVKARARHRSSSYLSGASSRFRVMAFPTAGVSNQYSFHEVRICRSFLLCFEGLMSGSFLKHCMKN